jgi:hypothetical protein
LLKRNEGRQRQHQPVTSTRCPRVRAWIPVISCASSRLSRVQVSSVVSKNVLTPAW